MKIEFLHLGEISYSQAATLMDEKKLRAVEQKTGFFFFLEHPTTYTSGLKTRPEHILSPGIEPVRISRGGSVTVHSPGQLIIYTVFPIDLTHGLEVFIRRLEGAIVEQLWFHGIDAWLSPPDSGVFTSFGKIAFVGLSMRNRIISHGAAVSLNNDLSLFDTIHSCGLETPMTSAKTILNKEISIENFSHALEESLVNRFSEQSKEEEKAELHKTLEKLETDPFYRYRLGTLYFNERRYRLAHEAFETYWHNCKVQDKRHAKLLQALTQLSTALYKVYENPNRKGATSQMGKAFGRVTDCEILPEILEKAPEFQTTLQDTLALLESEEHLTGLPPFFIQLRRADSEKK